LLYAEAFNSVVVLLFGNVYWDFIDVAEGSETDWLAFVESTFVI